MVIDWLDADHTEEELKAVFEATPAEGLTEIDIVGLKGKDVPIQRWAVEDRVPLGPSRCFPVTAEPGRALCCFTRALPTSLRNRGSDLPRCRARLYSSMPRTTRA